MVHIPAAPVYPLTFACKTGLAALLNTNVPPDVAVYHPLNVAVLVNVLVLLTVAPFEFLDASNPNPLMVYSFFGTVILDGLNVLELYVAVTLPVGVFVAPFLFNVIV